MSSKFRFGKESRSWQSQFAGKKKKVKSRSKKRKKGSAVFCVFSVVEIGRGQGAGSGKQRVGDPFGFKVYMNGFVLFSSGIIQSFEKNAIFDANKQE
ncbi:MAG: hypothetical protein HQ522_18615 [Bacteroidetes bacterium]|nr:hypothetical protein [Bacteroidota bacterium]